MRKSVIFVLIILSCAVTNLHSQIVIADSKNIPVNNNSILKIQSNVKGVLFPKVAKSVMDSLTSVYTVDDDGMLVHCSDCSTKTIYIFDFDLKKWIKLFASSTISVQNLSDVLSKGSNTSGIPISGISAPVNSDHIANKKYVDDAIVNSLQFLYNSTSLAPVNGKYESLFLKAKQENNIYYSQLFAYNDMFINLKNNEDNDVKEVFIGSNSINNISLYINDTELIKGITSDINNPLIVAGSQVPFNMQLLTRSGIQSLINNNYSFNLSDNDMFSLNSLKSVVLDNKNRILELGTDKLNSKGLINRGETALVSPVYILSRAKSNSMFDAFNSDNPNFSVNDLNSKELILKADKFHLSGELSVAGMVNFKENLITGGGGSGIRIMSNGYLGIGITPSKKLHVNGSALIRDSIVFPHGAYLKNNINSTFRISAPLVYITDKLSVNKNATFNDSITINNYLLVNAKSSFKNSINTNEKTICSKNNGKGIKILQNGNVGIDVSNPAKKLSVNGDIKLATNLSFDSGSIVSRAGKGLAFPSNTIFINKVGIGFPISWSSGPDYPLHVKGSVNKSLTIWGYGKSQWNAVNQSLTTFNAGIYCETDIVSNGKIAASNSYIFSDSRIKNITGISNSKSDLDAISKIQITNYKLKNSIQQNHRSVKKVIAQQIEKIFPQAVHKSTNVIPNIYKLARSFKFVNSNTISVSVENSLSIGDYVRIIIEEFSNENDGKIQELDFISEVILSSADAFTLNVDPKFKKLTENSRLSIFVYGKQVDDFRSVDYDAVSMLNVSATQELYKLIINLTEKIDNQNKIISSLKNDIILYHKTIENHTSENKKLEYRINNIEKNIKKSTTAFGVSKSIVR